MGFLSAIRLWLIKNKDPNNKRITTRVKKMEGATTDPQSPASSTLSTSSPSSGYTVSHKFEGGRRFQDIENVAYFLPNDNEEVDRLHQQHWIIKAMMGGNYQVPIESKLQEGITVLDSGCGPATWSLEMAEMYPNSTFYGIDAYPVFPTGVKPQNCHFELANVSESLPYPDNYFDFVHQRLLVFGLTRAGWENAISELIRVLKPGGYLEISECDFDFARSGPKYKRIMDSLGTALRDKTMIPLIGGELGPNFLEKNDQLEDLKLKKKFFPMNHHGKLGELFWDDLRRGFEGMHTWVIKECPDLQDREVYLRYLDECATECTEYQTDIPWYCYYGRKKAELVN
ncbi:S-adenosyl-L-methionine-dependent methyltransferase [Fennellomyces sp. T-0311]|nr:S-adenosyl-L-methionine-dependent methyltransferase [Fennellomyces sp. T-0311]